ncbi:MAG TPA: hypothetical protein VJ529_02120 [Candidatus Bathyarchaeia archaeon]|nr:hypothetical protein [Candidatus Bathyarchaeia archaeon]
MLLAGMPMYFKYSPRKEIAEPKVILLSSEAVMRRASRQEEKFFANVLRHKITFIEG